MRTLLSASSMMIGIAAVTLLFAVGSGAEKAYQAALESMGKNLLSVGSKRKPSSALRGDSQRFQTLTVADARAIMNELGSVNLSAPIAMTSLDLRYGGDAVRMTVIGTTPEFQITNIQPLSAGRFIDELDIRDVARVAVIGSQVEKKLFKGQAALGQRLLVGGAPFIVIGVLEEKGPDSTGSTQDDRILIPVTTAQRRLLNVDFVDRIFVQAVSKPMISVAIRQVSELLRLRHGLAANANDANEIDDFTIRDQAATLSMMSKTQQTLARFLAGIATLTLGLASVGLLAVSLLSVRERTAEIGLRLAVGALPGQVMMQFLSEAVMIALIGALAGLLVGVIGIMVGAWLLGWQLTLTVVNVLYTFLIALGLSLLFGAYPALRAARLDPIISLRAAH